MDKQNIVDIARKMFYEQGIANVSFKQLAEKCEVAPSLITYYFKTKSNIVTDVISQYCDEIEQVIAAKFYEQKIPYDIRVASIVDLLVKLQVYNEDEKARAFYLEYLNCGMETIFAAGFESIYRKLDKHIILDIDRSYDQLPSVAAAAHGVVLTLIYAYYSGKLSCTYEQFVDYVLTVRCKLLNLSEGEIQNIIQDGKDCFHRLDFHVQPYFVVN